MSRWLALEWDTREARVIAGRTSGRELVVEEAFGVDLRGGSPDLAPQQQGSLLAAALAERNLGRAELLVALPRNRAELRVLQVPPVPDEELPDLVRFQALRQFSSLAEDWLLDFVVLAGGQQQQRVLAAAISPAVLEDVQSFCGAFHGEAQRLVLRPFASASLVRRRGVDSRCRVLVELLADDADLTVLVDNQPVLVRSVRMPVEDPMVPLVTEIRRTIAAAQNQLGDQPVQAVTLVGSAEQLAETREALAQKLGLDVDVFDPFATVRTSPEFRPLAEDQRGRYAALLGLLNDEAAGQPHAIDFLNPRRRPPPANRRFRIAVVATVAAVFALLLGGLIWMQLRQYDNRLQRLRAESADLDEQVKIAEQVKTDAGEIDKFVIGDVNWLDEMFLLSGRFPPAEDAMVEQVTFNTIPSGGGQILLEGFVSEPGVIRELETKLRDARHQVAGSGAQLDDRRTDHPWTFKEKVIVLPPDLDQLAAVDAGSEPVPAVLETQADELEPAMQLEDTGLAPTSDDAPGEPLEAQAPVEPEPSDSPDAQPAGALDATSAQPPVAPSAGSAEPQPPPQSEPPPEPQPAPQPASDSEPASEPQPAPIGPPVPPAAGPQATTSGVEVSESPGTQGTAPSSGESGEPAGDIQQPVQVEGQGSEQGEDGR